MARAATRCGPVTCGLRSKPARAQAAPKRLIEHHALPGRVIASSSVPLRMCVDSGMFDTDLFFWLNTVHFVATDLGHGNGQPLQPRCIAAASNGRVAMVSTATIKG